MKRTIYIILLLLYTTLTHAYMYQNDMPVQQQQTKIGYTTNYGNSFQYSEPIKAPRQLGYTADERMYGSTNSYSQSVHSQAPRKAKGSGSSDNVTVTYETKWQSGLFNTTYLIIYTYPDGHIEKETVDSWFGYFTIESYAQDQAEKRAKEWAATHAVPIEGPIMPLLILMFLYVAYKKMGNNSPFFIYQNFRIHHHLYQYLLILQILLV